MNRSILRASGVVIFIGASLAAGVLYTRVLRAAPPDFPIYFANSTLTVEAQSLNRITYLPLVDIVRHLGLPYTDATALETFTIREGDRRLVLTRNSGLISVNDQIVLLQNPVRRENEQWLVPIDFLSQGLSRITGMEFRYEPGSARIFAGDVNPAELVMNAQALGPVTRLTIRTDRPIEIDLSRDDQTGRAVLALEPSPIQPLRESLTYRDRLIQSIAFDDADASPKIVVQTTNQVTDIRVTPADEQRVYFIDFLREAAAAPPPPPTAPPATRADPGTSIRPVRVIVIDPGHGGIETGAQGMGTVEKDLTLALARRLRGTLQDRLGATVLLTRDSDVGLTSEARSAVANNNQADLFISLHVGYSRDPLDSGSSVYIIPENFAANLSPASSGNRLFLPWFLGYRSSRSSSEQIATILQEELSKAVPGWKFPLRTGPVAVLTSATMPAVALEIGNLNNPVNTQSMLDPGFQGRLAATIANAVERFAVTRQSGI